MDLTEDGGGEQFPGGTSKPVAMAFAGDEDIAEARDLAWSFLARLQAGHGVSVSERTRSAVGLVVSELVTNARKYAPGPGLLTLEVSDGAIEVTVWDSEPQLPAVQATDPNRIGQHGLEIVMAVCRNFEVHRESVGKRVVASVVLAEATAGERTGMDPRTRPTD